MTISLKTIQKIFVATLLSIMLFVAYMPQANASSNYYPTYQFRSTQDLIAYLNVLLAQLQTLQQQQQQNFYTSTPRRQVLGTFTSRYYDYDVEVDTLRAKNVDDEEATLYGEVNLDEAEYAYVWFEYGRSGRFNKKTKEVRVEFSDRDTFRQDIDNLDEDEKYYFRAVASDPSGQRTYGNIERFITGGDSSGNRHNIKKDKPEVKTGNTRYVTDDSARIYGEVDMNDFDTGLVFFVYGEDENSIEKVDNEDKYSDVDEDGDDLQKYKTYTNLDGQRSFWLEMSRLNSNSDYYYRMCVEYEGENNDDTLECGDVESFETYRN